MITDAQYDDLVEDLAEDAWDEGEVSSLYQLGCHCNASSASEVGRRLQTDARITACVAATEITGLVYADVDQDWESALQALHQAFVDLRHLRRGRYCGDGRPWNAETISALQECDREAEAELVERINGAMRRWTDRIAEEDHAEGAGLSTVRPVTSGSPDPQSRDMDSSASRSGPVASGSDIDRPAGAGASLEPAPSAHCTSAGVPAAQPTSTQEQESDMATATERTAKQPIEAWYAGPALMWRCPKCRTEHTAETKACGCRYVRPTLHRLQEIAGLPPWADNPNAEPPAVGGQSQTDDPPGISYTEWLLRVQTQSGCSDSVLRAANDSLLTIFHDGGSIAEGVELVRPASSPPAIPETQAQAAAKEAAATGDETIVLEFTPAARCEASITLRRSSVEPEVWFDRIDQTTRWQEGRARGSTEALSEHFPGVQATRSHALACAFHRLRERWEGGDTEHLTPEGRKARKLALRQLATARRRLLGVWAGPKELRGEHATPNVALDESPAAGVKPVHPANGKPARRPKRRGPESATPAEPGPPSALTPFKSQRLLVQTITFRSDNPRGSIDQANVERLAKSIGEQGLQAPIGVRHNGDGSYEGWYGAHRFAAVRSVGHTEILANVYPAGTPDEVMRSLRADDNLAHGDLHPIARAQHYREKLLAAGWRPDSEDGPSLRSLAGTIGVSQGELSNQLGLLRLPKEWQDRLIAREITATQGRMLIPWIGRPAVLTGVAKGLEDHRRWHKDDLTTDAFEEIVETAINKCSRTCEEGQFLGYKDNRARYVLLTPKEIEEHREELDVVEIGTGHGKTLVAFNVKAFDRLQAAAEKAAAKREAKKRDAGDGTKRERDELTPAERKAREKQQAEQLEKRVARYKTRWLQQAASKRAETVEGHLGTKLLLYFAAIDDQRRSREVSDAVKSLGGKRKGGAHEWDVDAWGSLGTLSGPQFVAAARKFLAMRLTADTESSRAGLRTRDVPAIAAELGVEFEQEWRCDEEFLRLFTRDQLAGLVAEWKVVLLPAKTRDELIQSILNHQTNRGMPLAVPKVLTKAK